MSVDGIESEGQIGYTSVHGGIDDASRQIDETSYGWSHSRRYPE